MCGFGYTNKRIDHFDSVVEFIRRRGPDKTTRLETHGFSFFHHLLSITGDFSEQPFVNDSGDIYCLFNGQIYNHGEFGTFQTDGQCLIPAYQEFGNEFCRRLDGEFALVLADFGNNRLLLSTDTFSTKPIWMAFEDGEIGVASYQSVLERLGFKNPKQIPANTTLVYDLQELRPLKTTSVTDFDLNQFKDSYDDWIGAFENSIHKRSRDLREKIFMGLSSGYDSGAIACALARQEVPFKAYSIESGENQRVLQKRYEKLGQGEYIKLTRAQYRLARTHMRVKAENFVMGDYTVNQDPGAIGLSHICQLARNEGYKIYMSGQGADEVICDYGFAGRKIFHYSGFGGLFPEDLNTIFPYANFFEGTQTMWVYKEESVSGSHGIETRYPFLDKTCVQEFLWLKTKLKNQRYKAPIGEYLGRCDYPYDEGVKLGFSANRYLVLSPFNLKDLPRVIFRLLKALKNKLLLFVRE
ncbi:MAG: asparagine synthase-related protein [Verrucomicrobia bacterium]|nr:asparagine synthase-related protein [Verrucomicrobiota bacterium]